MKAILHLPHPRSADRRGVSAIALPTQPLAATPAHARQPARASAAHGAAPPLVEWKLRRKPAITPAAADRGAAHALS